MLEVVFNDSVKAAVTMAKEYDGKRMMQGAAAIGYIGEVTQEHEEALAKRRMEMLRGQPLGGSRRDVAYVGFLLDIGNPSGEVDGPERQQVFQQMWGRYPMMAAEDQTRFFDQQRRDLDRLLQAAAAQTPIRIWKSHMPYSACGFHYICHLLQECDCPLSVVSLPEYQLRPDNTMISYSGWGEIGPDKFHEFLPWEKSLSQIEKTSYAWRWKELVEENAPLRATINGRLVSVPEDFYDHLIIAALPQSEFQMARLIGELLGKHALGVPDFWYAYRIEKLIEEGRLAVVEVTDPTHPYLKILKPCTA